MREGIGLLATSVDVPIVPVHISGTYELLPKGRALPRRRRGSDVTVRFGAPIRLPPGAPAREVTRTVAMAIASLGDPDERS
jgi:1-acyl-sn-glycerol-3-phosphate acyltransferase